MYGPAQKCENNTVLKQKYTLKLSVAYFSYVSLGGNLDFLPKSFMTLTTGLYFCVLLSLQTVFQLFPNNLNDKTCIYLFSGARIQTVKSLIMNLQHGSVTIVRITHF